MNIFKPFTTPPTTEAAPTNEDVSYEKEVLTRLIRIETRLCKIAERMGVDYRPETTFADEFRRLKTQKRRERMKKLNRKTFIGNIRRG